MRIEELRALRQEIDQAIAMLERLDRLEPVLAAWQGDPTHAFESPVEGPRTGEALARTTGPSQRSIAGEAPAAAQRGGNGEGPPCEHCGKPLPPRKYRGGQPKRFCSSRCRGAAGQAARTTRRRAQAHAPRSPVEAPPAGEAVEPADHRGETVTAQPAAADVDQAPPAAPPASAITPHAVFGPPPPPPAVPFTPERTPRREPPPRRDVYDNLPPLESRLPRYRGRMPEYLGTVPDPAPREALRAEMRAEIG
jgi:hypothetical protein